MTIEEAIVDIRDNIKPVVGGISLDMAIKALEQMPKTGLWIKEREGGIYSWRCSNCKSHHRFLYDYCPSCGAKMESEVK